MHPGVFHLNTLRTIVPGQIVSKDCVEKKNSETIQLTFTRGETDNGCATIRRGVHLRCHEFSRSHSMRDRIVSISLAGFGVPFQGDFHAKKSFWSHSMAHLARNSIMTYYCHHHRCQKGNLGARQHLLSARRDCLPECGEKRRISFRVPRAAASSISRRYAAADGFALQKIGRVAHGSKGCAGQEVVTVRVAINNL